MSAQDSDRIIKSVWSWPCVKKDADHYKSQLNEKERTIKVLLEKK